MKYRVRDAIHWKFIKRNLIDLLEGFFRVTLPPHTSLYGKKILLFNWRDTKHRFAGGAEVYIHELAKEWVKQGHTVTVFCGNDSSSLRNETVDGVHIVRRGGFYFVYIWAFLYYMVQFRGKYDVVIDSQNGIPFFTPLYVKEPIYSLLFHVHQEVFRKSLVKPLADIAAFLEKSCMPAIYKETPFLTISPSTQAEIIRLGLGQKGISIIYPGVDLQKLIPGEKSERPMVLYLGRLKYYKRVDVLLHAAKEILSKNQNVRFVIAGDGEYKKNLKQIAKRLELEPYIEFRGRVSEEEKIILYQKAWVVINPSMMEGWGITTVEANACGTPVIASNVPGLHDSVKDGYNGFLFSLANHKELAEKITLILNHRYQRTIMSKNAVEWASRYDWKISARNCFNTLFEKRKIPSLSIGIPAFNEEKTIPSLLTSLLRQKEDGFVLKEILVASDGSTDKTVEKVKKITDGRIKVLSDTSRIGKSARINQLLSEMKSDVVALLDADIRIDDDHLLSDVLKDSDVTRTGLIAVKAQPQVARTFFEKCINHNVAMQNEIRKKWNHGDNYLSFRGCFLVMAKSFAKNLVLPEDIVNNDAYIYFKAKQKNYLPRYTGEKSILYRSPATFSDHLKQSMRFQYSVSELETYFGKEISSQYRIPRKLFLLTFLTYFALNPILFSGYLFIFLRTKIARSTPLKSTWNIAASTKTA